MATYKFTTSIDEAPEGGYVSYCPELGVASQGESVEEAFANIGEAISTFLDAINELGDAEAFFRERGIKGDSTNIVVRRHFTTQTLIQFDTGRIESGRALV